MKAETSSRPVALVTGGGRGIGLGITRALAAEGWDIAFCGNRSAEDNAQSIEKIRQSGLDNGFQTTVRYYVCNIADDPQRAALLQSIRSDFGKLNALVNNAGVGAKTRADVLEMLPDNFDWLMNINLRGPFFLTQAVGKWLLEQKQADPDFKAGIVNISSISATVASISRGEYCLSKAAVSMATQLWATRLAPAGIGVYEVRPGIIHSDMTAVVTEKYDRLIAQGLTIQPRWGEPADIGKAVAMLLRGDLPYSPGQVIMVDGGMGIPRL